MVKRYYTGDAENEKQIQSGQAQTQTGVESERFTFRVRCYQR